MILTLGNGAVPAPEAAAELAEAAPELLDVLSVGEMNAKPNRKEERKEHGKQHQVGNISRNERDN